MHADSRESAGYRYFPATLRGWGASDRQECETFANYQRLIHMHDMRSPAPRIRRLFYAELVREQFADGVERGLRFRAFH